MVRTFGIIQITKPVSQIFQTNTYGSPLAGLLCRMKLQSDFIVPVFYFWSWDTQTGQQACEPALGLICYTYFQCYIKSGPEGERNMFYQVEKANCFPK